MERIIDYKLVYSADIDDLERRVQEYLRMGWRLSGGITVWRSFLVRELVRYSSWEKPQFGETDRPE